MTCASKRLLGDSGRDAAIGIDAMRAWIGSVAANLLCWGGNFRRSVDTGPVSTACGRRALRGAPAKIADHRPPTTDHRPPQHRNAATQ
ncbi:hypothetical protein, partial [Burkholderia pseudomallei]|uniref:hypothetical protein n=3 Tax=pseudomallei group TaxID=111527 RepID=UPI001C6DF6ED